MDPTKRPSSQIAETVMGSSSILKQVTSIGPIWVFPTSTMARSNAPTSTAKIAGSSSRKESLSRRSRSISRKRTASLMRANLDGSDVETLVETGRGDTDRRDQTRWCVGITIDPKLGKIYWTQKGPTKGGLGRLCRANTDVPKGESPTNRSDIEVLFDQLPEPID